MRARICPSNRHISRGSKMLSNALAINLTGANAQFAGLRQAREPLAAVGRRLGSERQVRVPCPAPAATFARSASLTGSNGSAWTAADIGRQRCILLRDCAAVDRSGLHQRRGAAPARQGRPGRAAPSRSSQRRFTAAGSRETSIASPKMTSFSSRVEEVAFALPRAAATGARR